MVTMHTTFPQLSANGAGQLLDFATFSAHFKELDKNTLFSWYFITLSEGFRKVQTWLHFSFANVQETFSKWLEVGNVLK